MSKHLFLGVDGGATSCRARLCNLDGDLLGEGLSGPANIYSDLAGSLRSIQAACQNAFMVAGLSPLNTYHTHAGLGLAGAGVNSASERARAEADVLPYRLPTARPTHGATVPLHDAARDGKSHPRSLIVIAAVQTLERAKRRAA